MRLTPLTASIDVKAAFDVLLRSLSHGCRAIETWVGWQGGHEKVTVHWNQRLRFWSLLDDKRVEKRYWCCFGTEDPTKINSVNIICEANPPKEHFDRRTAGVLLRDDAGKIYLAHSGKVGGGRKGIGKSTFLSFYQGKLVSVQWPDGQDSDLIVIGQIDGKDLASQIAHFVREVSQFKQAAVTQRGRIPLSKLPASFKPEFSGNRKSYLAKGRVIAECWHGPLISALAKELDKRNLKYGNDRARDLFVVSDTGNVRILFEAKTDLNTATIYGGIGQLMLHGAAERFPPKKILVVPGSPKPKTRAALRKLGIVTLTYKQDNGHFELGNLNDVFR